MIGTERRGFGLGLASALVFSTTAIFIRYLTETYSIPPLVLALWRDVLLVVPLAAFFAIARPRLLRAGREHLGYLALYGLLLAVYNGSWTFSVALNGAAVATVLVYCSGAFAVLLGWLLLGERVSWAKVAAVLMTVCGCALIAGVVAEPVAVGNGAVGSGAAVNLSGVRVVGAVVGTFAGLCYAGYSLMGRAAARRGLDPWTTLLYTFGFASLWLLAANMLPQLGLPGAAARPGDLLWLGRSAAGWLALLGLAVGPTLFGYGLYNMTLAHLPSSIANLIVTLEPGFTAVIAYWLLGERLGRMQVAGAVVTLGGVVLLRIYEGRAAARAGSAGAARLDTREAAATSAPASAAASGQS